jgi:hypothetical protein
MHYKNFEYQFTDGTMAIAFAVIAAHNNGIGVLIELESLEHSSFKRKIKFVADTRFPKSIAFANILNDEKLIEYAIKKFISEKWGDRLLNTASEDVYIEPIQ